MLVGGGSSGGRLPSGLSWRWWWSERSGRASGRVRGARGKVVVVVEWNVSSMRGRTEHAHRTNRTDMRAGSKSLGDGFSQSQSGSVQFCTFIHIHSFPFLPFAAAPLSPLSHRVEPSTIPVNPFIATTRVDPRGHDFRIGVERLQLLSHTTGAFAAGTPCLCPHTLPPIRPLPTWRRQIR